MPPERELVQSWLHTETTRLLATVDTFWDRRLTDDSSLPGWSLGHLLSHLARNADALCNLLAWARTGIETPMYTSTEQRGKDIELGALRPGAAILTDVVDSAARFRTATELLSENAWSQEVVTAQGRTVPAAYVPWLRLREVAVHHVDLGAAFDDLPSGLIKALLDDVLAAAATKPGWPSLRLESTDHGDVIEIGAEPATAVAGTRAQLLAWLTGRAHGHGLNVSTHALPALPAWL
jgi:maleylpyruvate isomerase